MSAGASEPADNELGEVRSAAEAEVEVLTLEARAVHRWIISLAHDIAVLAGLAMHGMVHGETLALLETAKPWVREERSAAQARVW